MNLYSTVIQTFIVIIIYDLITFYIFSHLHLWTIKTPTRRRFIGHKGNVTSDIINVRRCKMPFLLNYLHKYSVNI